MKLPLFTILFSIVIASYVPAYAQVRRSAANSKPPASKASAEVGQSAVVIDETLSLLRERPSLFSASIQRMRIGRKIQILGVARGDGVTFYRVTVPPANFGWVQADAVFGKFRKGDEERLAQLVQAAEGFEQIAIAQQFFSLYPDSKFKPSILLLYGDLIEVIAAKFSNDAARRLSRRKMAASAAPVHSYYLNFVSLDRYRKLGISFLFNSATRQFHYDGSSWKEIVTQFAGSVEHAEAQKRLNDLKAKMEMTVTR